MKTNTPLDAPASHRPLSGLPSPKAIGDSPRAPLQALRPFLAAVFLCACAGANAADPPAVIAQQAYLKASNTGADHYFGYAVAVSGETVVVGAFQESTSAPGSGAVYVYVRAGTNWTQQALLKASNPGASDNFGYSVAISGDTIVVGGYLEDSSATGVNGDQNNDSALNAGAAYVFVRSGTTWSQEAYLKGSNTRAGDHFGGTVAVAGDTVVVGTVYETSSATGVNGNQNDTSATLAGAAYVFVRSGGSWSQQAYLKASNTGAGDQFGQSVAVSGDTVVVGAYFEDSNATVVNGNQSDNSASGSGAAYVFVRDGTNWSQEAYLKASNTGAGDGFGASVAVSGETVVVGANTEASSATGVNGNQSDNSASQAGAAYVFVRDGTTWSQQAYLKASNADAGDYFGGSVAVSGDTVVVGANVEASSATGVNGNQSDNSMPSGAAYVFARNGTTWCQPAYLKASNTGPIDGFGTSVSVSGDTVVAGAFLEDSSATGVNGSGSDTALDSGAAYVFSGALPLSISPPSTSVAPGAMATFSACGGTPPYMFTNVNITSGGNITSNGVYTAGNTPGTDLVRVLDNAGNSATGMVTVTCANSSGLVAFWRAENNANDSAGANHGTLESGATFAAGSAGVGFSLDGVDDYVRVPHSASLDPGTGSFTVGGWFRTTRTTGTQVIVTKYECGGSCPGGSFSYYGLYLADGRAIVGLRSGAGSTEQGLSDTRSLADGLLHHAAMQRDMTAGQVRLFVDGVLVASAALIPSAAGPIGDDDGEPDPFTIGAQLDSASTTRIHFFQGMIDEVTLHNRALSAAEILSYYQCVVPPPLQIAPVSTNVAPGTMVTFTATGGTPPYTFTNVTINSGAGGGINATGLYTAGLTAGVTDLVRVTDNTGNSATSAVNAACSPLSGLVGWWRGDGNGTDSVNGNNVTLSGGAGHAAGQVGQAFQFDGVDDSGKINASSALNVGTGAGLTLSAWINPSDVEGSHALVEWNDLAHLYGVHFYQSASTLYANVAAPGNVNHQLYSAAGVIVTGRWQHVALTYDRASGIGAMYRDGVVVAQDTLGSYTPETGLDLYFGKREYGCCGEPPYWYQGGMDEVRVYNRALTASEVLSYYQCVVPPPLQIAPASTNVTPGATVTFTATNGTPPYTFSDVSINSGAGGGINSTGLYTAGLTAGVTDLVRVTDSSMPSQSATGMVTVIDPCSLPTGAPTYNWVAWTYPGGSTASAAVPGLGSAVVSVQAGSIGPFTVRFDNVPFTSTTVNSPSASTGGSTWGFDIDFAGVSNPGGLVLGLGNFAHAAGFAGYRLSAFDRAGASLPLASLLQIGSYDHTWTGFGIAFNDDMVLNTTNGNLEITTVPGANDNNADILLLGLPAPLGRISVTSLGPPSGDAAGDTVNIVLGRALSFGIAPASASVVSGGTVTFSAANGVPPYVFSLVQSNSGGGIASNGVTTALYTAGPTNGVTDTVMLIDARGCAVLATVTVSLPPAPEIVVEQPAGTGLVDGAATIDFGTVIVGTSGAVKTFTVRNTGTASLTGLAVTADGANTGDFTLNTGGLAASLAPGASTTFSVTFNPAAPGARTAALHIASNDADENPFDITLTGTGQSAPEIAVEQPVGSGLTDGAGSIDFGAAVVGTSSTAKTFTIRNTGTASLTGLAVTKDGANAGDFTLNTGAMAASLAPGGSTTFTFTFNPSASGARTAALHIASNDAGENPFDIALAGTGITPLQLAQQAVLKASNPGAGDLFGLPVAMSGNTLVVGALWEASSATGVNGNQSDDSALQAGAAYVFVKTGSTWRQQAYLKASNTQVGDVFGYSVAVSGDTIVVGARWEDSNATGVNGNQADNSASRAGAAYVFVRSGTTWTQQAYLKASNPGADDNFGTSVAVSGDTIVIGSPFEDSMATGVDGDGTNNGSTNSGAAYVFVRSGTTWSQQAYLKPSNTSAIPDPNGDQFGTVVGISGDTVVVGAPYEDSNDTGVNGNQGDNSLLESGAAYVYSRAGTTWSQQAYLKASNAGYADRYGIAVTVSDDTVVVGARDESSGASGVNGNQNDESALGAGAAYVYVRNGSTWTQQAYLKASNPGGVILGQGVGDQFGGAVVLSGDILIVGAAREDSDASGVNGAQGDAPGGTNSGAAYVFVRRAGIWSQEAYLKASNPGGQLPGEPFGDLFGASVGVSGTSIVVGANLEDSSGYGVNGHICDEARVNSGAVYVFDLTDNVALGPDIAVEQPAGTDLVDGLATVDYSAVALGAPAQRTFTVRNRGSADLMGLGITITGPNAAEFTLTTSPAASVPPACGSTTFTVAFSPVAPGTRTASLQITSNDSDESPFDIALTGQGSVAPPPVAIETFNYAPAGAALLGASGGSGFSGSWFGDTSNDSIFTNLVAADGSLVVPGFQRSGHRVRTPSLTAAGGVARTLATPFGTVGATFYVSCVLRPEGTLGVGQFNGYFGYFLRASTGNNHLFVGKPGTASATPYGLERLGGTGQVVSGVVPVVGSNVLLVLKVELLAGNDRSTLYINPAPGAPEPASGLVKSDMDMGTVLGINLHGTGASSIDELRIGTNYASVVPALCPAEIHKQPVGATTVVGLPVSLQMASAGQGPLTYQWQQDGVNLVNGGRIAGATTPTLTINPTALSDNGAYRMIVSTPCGAVTSAVANVSVVEGVWISTQPTNQLVYPGSNATFTVAAIGVAPLLYQWRLNGTPVPDATNATLALTNVQFAQMGGYTAIVSNSFGAATSQVATLTLLIPPTIVLQPLPVTASVGSDATFSVTVTNTATLPINYQWRKGSTPLTNILLNSTSCTFTLYNVQTNVTATNGPGNYRVVCTNAATIGAGTASSLVALTVTPATDLAIAPAAKNVLVEQSVTFTASGGMPTYQFDFSPNPPASGATIVSNGVSTALYTAGRTAGTDTVRVRDASGTAVTATVNVTYPLHTNGHYYRLVLTGINWPNARDAAAAQTYLGLRGHLVTINDALEQAFVSANFSNHFPVSSGGTPVWIGGFQPALSVEPSVGWRWVTGEAFGYLNWHALEPNEWRRTNENAIEIRRDGTWNDQSSFARPGIGYVVEYEAPFALVLSPATEVLPPGGQRTFTALGGVPPYTTLEVSENNSGAGLVVTNGAYTGIYTAGATPAVTDTLRVTDSLGATATATVMVGVPPTLSVFGRVTLAGSGAPLPGITILLNSPGGMTSTVTDGDGRYEFPAVPTGQSHTLTPALDGFTFAPPSSPFTLGLGNRMQDFTGAQLQFEISGTVTEPDGAGIGNAAVSVTGPSPETVKTDGRGFYKSSLLAGGSYTLTVSRFGYTFSAPQTVPNLTGNTTVDFTGTLLLRTISGVVMNQAGTGVAGVNVNVVRTNLSALFSTNATTDAQGRYAVSNLRPEIDYVVAPVIGVTPPIPASFTPSSSRVSTQLGDAVADFLVVRSYTISGRITEGAGNLSDVLLLVTNVATGQRMPHTLTLGNSNPNYSTQPLPEGATYLVTPSLAGRTFSPANRTVANLAGAVTGSDFTATPVGPLAGIAGMVTNSDGLGQAGVAVQLSGAANPSQTTGAGGAFNFANVPAGQNYRLTFSRSNLTFTPPFIDFLPLAGNTRTNVRATLALPLTGRIAGVSSASGPILVMNADSSARTVAGGRALAGDGLNGMVSLSRDAKQLAFVSAVGRDVHLFVMNADGSGLRQVTARSGLNARSPAWSPSGDRLAFVTVARSRFDYSYLVVINADGTGSRETYLGSGSSSVPQSVAWSPEEDRVVVGVDGRASGMGHSVLLYYVNSSFPAAFWSDLRVQDTIGVAWGANGRIAFNALDGANRSQIFTMPADRFRTDVRQVTSHTSGDAYSPTWSPDGTRLAYGFRPAAGASQIMAIGADGSLPTRLTAGAAPCWAGIPFVDTPAGPTVTVTAAAAGAAVTFANVTMAGATTILPATPAQRSSLPAGYFSIQPIVGFGEFANYEITTTASYNGPLTVCFTVPPTINSLAFLGMRVLHAENGVLMDRTITSGPNAPNYGTRRVCAQVSSLSPFHLTQLADPALALITGSVLDANGHGVEGVRLSANDTNVLDTVTDDEGRFAFVNLTPGQSYVITPLDANSDFTPAAALLAPVAGENTLVFVSAPRSGPPMSIAPDPLNPGRYIITWEAAADAYVLESTGMLDAQNWIAATEAVSFVGEANTVSIPATNTTRFFRLRKQ